MMWHQRGRSNDEDLMRYPVDGNEWKEVDEKYPEFSREPRNVRLGLADDGFNPFGTIGGRLLPAVKSYHWMKFNRKSFQNGLRIRFSIFESRMAQKQMIKYFRFQVVQTSHVEVILVVW
ncbi:uncharacterized protein LOC112091779 [Morus notabilis]|uniref:uncharacterized protein LOC112091779 n=1 Tax=Morus notabilis TaxID=981085 RepID=UPI000CED2D78|nr:uncharacterized protein LOC112091779 [Morus notabilis]